MSRGEHRVGPRPSQRIVIGALVLACGGEGFGYLLYKAFDLRAQIAAPGASSWFVSAMLLSGRFLGSALLLARYRPSRAELTQGLWLGGFAGVANGLLIDGMNFSDTSTSAFLSQGFVAILPVLGAIAARRLPSFRIVGAVVISMIGLAVLARFDPRELTLGRGEAEILLAACAFAGQIFSISRPRYAGNRAGAATLVMFASAGVLGLPVALLTSRPRDFERLTQSADLWLLLGLITVCATLVPMWLMNRYQRHVTSTEAGIIYGAEPVIASALSLFLPSLITPIVHAPYPNESLSPRLIFAGLLVLLANFLLEGRPSKQKELATT